MTAFLEIPEIHRTVRDSKLWLTLPLDARHPRTWLLPHLPARTKAEYLGSCIWVIARAHYAELVIATLQEFESVQIRWDAWREEKCTVSCQAARPETVVNCVCCCMGDNHGGVGAGRSWTPVGDQLLISGEVVSRVWVESDAWRPPAVSVTWVAAA